MTPKQLADEFESWARTFDAMVKPGHVHERASQLRQAAGLIRERDELMAMLGDLSQIASRLRFSAQEAVDGAANTEKTS